MSQFLSNVSMKKPVGNSVATAKLSYTAVTVAATRLHKSSALVRRDLVYPLSSLRIRDLLAWLFQLAHTTVWRRPMTRFLSSVVGLFFDFFFLFQF